MIPGVDANAHDSHWSEFVAKAMGLHYPPERWGDLRRGLAAAADELGFSDIARCVESLRSAPLTKAQLQVLASHLTVGETYFFRDRRTFAALAENALPELIRTRRGRDQRLRLWSAACCTGEEAYSLAILLHQLLPDLADWRVEILATDINDRFLHKATAGVYGEWSFREAPDGFKERYFQRKADGRHVIAPEIRAMVTFAHLNLIDEIFPARVTGPAAMDVIFCRNVLMYFTAAQTRRVVANLHGALADGGWLAVSPSESSQVLFSRFVTVNSPGAILYRRSDAASRPPSISALPLETQPRFAPAPEMFWTAPSNPPAAHDSPAGRDAAAPDADPPLATPEFSQLARSLANERRLDEALAWCDRWIAADKLDAAAHHLRANILLEKGEADEARRSLQRAVYLQPDLALAHFTLGHLAREQGKIGEAEKHFTNALSRLARLPPAMVLPESDGLTAGGLVAAIGAANAWERTA